jgi:putative ABC transport system permease protein
VRCENVLGSAQKGKGIVLQDLHYGFRQLLRRKASSLLAILTLALGIGATTSIFTVVDSTMLRPLPYQNPEQLVSATTVETRPDGRESRTNPSMQDMLRLRQATDIFSSVEGFGSSFNGRITDGAAPERLQVATFTEGYLSQHGVIPLIGRDFTAEDMAGTSPLVALLGYGYWQSRFGGEDVLGQTIRLDDSVATIVGILPRTFNPNTPVSLPLILPPDMVNRRGLGSTFNVVARLQPGVSIEAAAERATPRVEGAKLRLTSRLDTVTTPQRPTVRVLLGAVGLVLLLACVNVAGLLLARGAARRSEVAVRASLGASRPRLIRQLLTESLAIAIPGAVLGVFLAWVSLDAFVANVPLFIPSNSPAAINLTVLAATMLVLIPTVLFAGLLPAVRLSRVRLGSALASGGRQGSSSLSRRGGQLLIALESALAVLLVCGAGLMVRSMWQIARVDLGFDTQRLMTMEVLPLDKSPGAHEQYYLALLAGVKRLPGVESAAVSDYFHLGTGMRSTALQSTGKFEMLFGYRVSPEYFETVGTPLVGGRWPTPAEARAEPGAIVINESAAALLFPSESALGRIVKQPGPAGKTFMVVGITKNARNGGPTAPSTLNPWHVFYPFQITERDMTSAMTVVIRTSGDARNLASDLRSLAGSIGPRVLVERIRSGEELIAAGVLTPRRRTVMLSLFGALGLLLAVVGIIGVTAFSVTSRTREIGVRLAFGASPRQVVRVILRDAAVPVVAGAIAGAGGAYLSGGVLRTFLFEVSPTDPLTIVSVTLLMTVVGVLAALVPALRAAGIDPASSLRTE